LDATNGGPDRLQGTFLADTMRPTGLPRVQRSGGCAASMGTVAWAA
jgi:hypothetical protein